MTHLFGVGRGTKQVCNRDRPAVLTHRVCFRSGCLLVMSMAGDLLQSSMRRCSLAVGRHWLLPEDHGHGLVHL